VWKFDVTGNATSGTLLFTATNGANQKQPITSPIEIGAPPPGQSGVMLYFGTGRFYANGDNLQVENDKIQSFYGVHDSFPNKVTAFGRSDLTQQQILFEGANPNSNHMNTEIRLVSNVAVDYKKKSGWYLDLIYNNVKKGERVVSAPLLRFGRVIFTTLIPSTDPCDFGGDSWLMELDAISGGRLSYSVFDLDENKLFDEGDYVNVNGDKAVSGQKSKIGIVKTPAVISAGEIEYKVMSGTTGEVQVVSEKGGKMTGRVSWREIFNK
jgi:type IV pilus assembly protein PilY1